MRLPKLLIFVLAFCLLFYYAVASSAYASAELSSAQQEFSVDYNSLYEVQEDGSAKVKHQISLTNNFSRVYATTYTFALEGDRPEDIKVSQDGEELPFELSQEENQWKIKARFPEAVVGKGKSRLFSIEYNLTELASQNGQVWELAIPRLGEPERVENYALKLQVPAQFGRPAYISPQPRTKSTTGQAQSFTFQKEDLVKAGVVAAFGEFQVFSFELSYHLENKSLRTGKTEIALPPDTAFQRVYYEKIIPQPLGIRIDEDGNWLASYMLSPEEKIDVKAVGAVQIFATPQEHYSRIRPSSRYLGQTKYWPAKDPQIKELAGSLGTPRVIYDFVVDYLSYDYSRVREGVERLGAKEALLSPGTAICMEFTDLFIATARAAGIPAREVNGFAYTENPEIQPLSLVADVLHAWPEYWDEELGIWKPVDPTWGNTTGGIDFFDKFDLSHFVFVIHGKDTDIPPPAGAYKLSSNPQKDVIVEFGSLPEKRRPEISISATLPKTLLPIFSNNLKITVQNSGPAAAYDLPVRLETQGVSLSKTKSTISSLPPYTETSVLTTFKIPLVPSKRDRNIVVVAGSTSFVYNLPAGKILLLQVILIFTTLASGVAVAFLLAQKGLIKPTKNEKEKEKGQGKETQT